MIITDSKKRNDIELHIMAIVAIVGIVAIVLGFFANNKRGVSSDLFAEENLVGQAFSKQKCDAYLEKQGIEFLGSKLFEKQCSQYYTCSDSDGGIDYYAFGQVKVEGDVNYRKDECSDTWVIEQFCRQDVSELPSRYYCDKTNGACYTKLECPNGCQDGACLKEPTQLIKEQVKCVFKGSTQTNKCYSADPEGWTCEGKDSCVIDVGGPPGLKITWKSSCGGYAYTTLDGQNEYVEFYCREECTDSDGGIDFYTASQKEQCSIGPDGESVLEEHYCYEDFDARWRVICTIGCENGVCLGEPREIPNCVDGDNGLNYYEKSKASGATGGSNEEDFFNTIYVEDYCNTDGPKTGLLDEYYCRDGLLRSSSFPCPNGCQDGACIPISEETCTDSDGGKDYDTKGTTSGYDSTFGYHVHTDECVPKDNTTYLEEGYCDARDNDVWVEHIICEYGCQDGACVDELPLSCSNGILDGDESDVDCGGSCFNCDLFQKCNTNFDCSTNYCDSRICKNLNEIEV